MKPRVSFSLLSPPVLVPDTVFGLRCSDYRFIVVPTTFLCLLFAFFFFFFFTVVASKK